MERVVGSEFTSKRIFEKIISKTFEISNYLQVLLRINFNNAQRTAKLC